jgi:hypothetical protein
MGGSAQISVSSIPPAHKGSGLALALLLVTVLAFPAGALALGSRSWLLQDQAGRSWALNLLEQADPTYPGGPRLRLTDRSGSQPLDHQRPLHLSDGMGGAWDLGNRSGELVPAAGTALPDASAQFDLPRLEPRPRAELPLLLTVPLASGNPAQLMLTPEAVAALHATTGP